jgi:hypothetical protein
VSRSSSAGKVDSINLGLKTPSRSMIFALLSASERPSRTSTDVPVESPCLRLEKLVGDTVILEPANQVAGNRSGQYERHSACDRRGNKPRNVPDVLVLGDFVQILRDAQLVLHVLHDHRGFVDSEQAFSSQPKQRSPRFVSLVGIVKHQRYESALRFAHKVLLLYC